MILLRHLVIHSKNSTDQLRHSFPLCRFYLIFTISLSGNGLGFFSAIGRNITSRKESSEAAIFQMLLGNELMLGCSGCCRLCRDGDNPQRRITLPVVTSDAAGPNGNFCRDMKLHFFFLEGLSTTCHLRSTPNWVEPTERRLHCSSFFSKQCLLHSQHSCTSVEPLV